LSLAVSGDAPIAVIVEGIQPVVGPTPPDDAGELDNVARLARLCLVDTHLHSMA